jgi:hypothetical protein
VLANPVARLCNMGKIRIILKIEQNADHAYSDPIATIHDRHTETRRRRYPAVR